MPQHDRVMSASDERSTRTGTVASSDSAPRMVAVLMTDDQRIERAHSHSTEERCDDPATGIRGFVIARTVS